MLKHFFITFFFLSIVTKGQFLTSAVKPVSKLNKVVFAKLEFFVKANFVIL